MNTTDREKADKLLELVREFVKEHEIGHEETIFQCDGPQLSAPEFIAKLCEVAGYHQDTEG